MRLVISAFAVAALFAGFITASTDASAQEGRKYRNYDRYDDYDRERSDAYRIFRRLVPGYEARNPDNFRFGSDAWWKAMDREGRGGHPRL
jgi:hypothetical protein